MSTSGETHDPDTIRSNAELFSARSDDSDGSLSVTEFDGVVVFWAKPVLKDKRGHAQRIQPIRHLSAFVVHG
jgi:hypothetical protein